MGIEARSSAGSLDDVDAGVSVVVVLVAVDVDDVVVDVVVVDEVLDDAVEVDVLDEVEVVFGTVGPDVGVAGDGTDESAVVAPALPQAASAPSATNDATIRYRTASTVSHHRGVDPFTVVQGFVHRRGQTEGMVGRTSRLGRLTGAAGLTIGLGLTACGTDGPGEAGRGSALYRANCAACHGEDLGGTRRGPALLGAAEVTDAAIVDAIRNGVDSGGDLGPMAAIPRLDDSQIEAIVDHLRDVRGVDDPSP